MGAAGTTAAWQAMLREGRGADLERACRHEIARRPDHPDAPFYLALALERRGARAEAIEWIERSVAHDPSAERLGQLARMLLQLRRDDEALAVARRACDAPPRSALDHDTIGCVFARLGHHEEALACFEAACAIDPDQAQFHYNRACELHFTGCPDAADAHERVLAIDPLFARSHLALATIDVVADRQARVERIERILPAIQAVDARLAVHAAAAKDLERLGAVERAFDHITAGKAAWRRRIGYDPARDEATFSALRQAFEDPGYFSGPGCRDAAPVFVVGMPRSGTTLVDRILSRHPDLVSAGELQAMPMAARAASTGQDRNLWSAATIAGLKDARPATVGETYLRLAAGHVSARARWIDKLPMNFLYVGHILHALPDARIVCLRRDPMDVVWSNYKHLFAAQVPAFAYSLDPVDTARYVARFEQLTRYWQERFPGRFHIVAYERLVDDLESETRAMLDHIGLPYHADCLRFFENASPVATPSASQVRQPLYRSSIGAWRRVETQLHAARAELERHGITVDDDPSTR